MRFLDADGLISKSEPVKIFVMEHNEVSSHNHAFLELVYVLSGKAVHTLDGAASKLHKGDFIFINHGSHHAYKKYGDEPFVIMNCLFVPYFIDTSLSSSVDFGDILNHYLIKLRQESLKQDPSQHIFKDPDGRILHYMNHMLEEYERRESGYLELIRCSLIELIIEAMRQINKSAAPWETGVSAKVVARIQAAYMEPLTLTSLAKEFSFSLPYLSKKFKEDTGFTFCEYLQKERIEQSCRLLVNTDKPIDEIASLVGYGDMNYFGALFRQRLHMSPGKYRRLTRKL